MSSPFQSRLKEIERTIGFFLPESPSHDWLALSFADKSTHAALDTAREALLKPVRSLVDCGGKRWRPLLAVLCARALAKGKGEKLAAQHAAEAPAALVEAVHTASLIHDDIEDSSLWRRGKPAVHVTFGVDTAINAASWLYFHASLCIENLDLPPERKLLLYEAYLLELRRLHLGQAADIAWHKDREAFPTVESYLWMVKNKTGALSRLAAKMGILASGGDATVATEAGDIAAKIGAGFQIIDDVLNLTSGNAGKKRGDDIVEGKKSLPVLLFVEHCRVSADEGAVQHLMSLFDQAADEGIESPAVEEAIALLNSSSCIKDASHKGKKLIEGGTRSLLELFGKEDEDAKLIEELFVSMLPENLSQRSG